MTRRWRIVPHDQTRVQGLAQTAAVPPVVAQLLVSRGVYTPQAASEFLETRLSQLRDPLELPGVRAAVPIIMSAIADGRPIVIYGDYDCDGMTSCAILVRCLRLLGGKVSYHVPNRLEDGYGLNEQAIRDVASRGCNLIITVDCGINAIACAELCRELDVELIITDHHVCQPDLPDAAAIVHPRLPGTSYPFGELCGAGVAFKLSWALCQQAAGAKKVTPPMRKFLMQAIGLAAIGTVADVVPLLDENRILVRHGLKTLKADPPCGLAELMRVLKLDQVDELTTESIGFAIGPRLNAAGRLGQAQLGVELMTIEDPVRAKQLAEYINELNGSRESLQRSVQIAAQKQANERFNVDEDAALVLAGVGWHPGVIGVVAGRLADKYARPVIIISQDAAGRGEAVGSGRVGGTGVNLHEALSECEHHLVRFGGHAAAAGLTIDEKRIDAFREEFCQAVAQQWDEKEIVPEIRIDAETSLGQLNLNLVSQIETLAPFGAGNPRPVLCCRGVTLDEEASTMGAGDRHLRVRFAHGDKVFRAVAFGAASWVKELNETTEPIEIAYRPIINDWNGMRKVEIHLVDWRVSHSEATVS
ncbi:MAG: single-stranded-DNA-specific exonuclease RecJ [Planctomycetota bacterium]